MVRPAAATTAAAKPKTADARTTTGQENSAPNLARTGSVRTEKPPAAAPSTAKTAGVPRTNSMVATNNDEIVRQVDGLQKENTDLKADIEGLEKERDFYFDKLRDIEVLLQEEEDKGQGTTLTAAIFKILYATADGFETVTAADEAVDDAKIEDDTAPTAVDVEETY